MNHGDVPSLRRQAMKMLADAGAIFIGQGVAADGVATFQDFQDVPDSQKIEFPVAEELNVGAATGMSLAGLLPVVSLPRMDFLLRAMDQLVNHLDKLEEMSVGQFKPKVIIRVRVGARTPLDAGPQHTNDYTWAFGQMLTNVTVWRLDRSDEILMMYRAALESARSTLIVEAL
jgi:pyruvate/2-oxoglutarate/acetoin dehydrogenase E1 component